MQGPKKKAKPPPPSPPKRSKFKPPRKRKGDHSDSDEDWTPWTETTQRSSNRGINNDVFGFDSLSQCCRNLSDNRTFFYNVRQKTPVCRTKCPTKNFRPKTNIELGNSYPAKKWRRPLLNKNKRKEKQIRRWNKLKTKQNMEQSGHSNTVGNQAGRGWHLKMVKWHQTCTSSAAWPTTSSNNIDSDRSIMSLLLLCVTKVKIISSIVCLSIHLYVMLCFCWHHNVTSDSWTIITLNFTGITLSIRLWTINAYIKT